MTPSSAHGNQMYKLGFGAVSANKTNSCTYWACVSANKKSLFKLECVCANTKYQFVHIVSEKEEEERSLKCVC